MYKVSRSEHCSQCPKNTAPDSDNPHICHWTNEATMPEGRVKVIRIVERLMRNNPEPWCSFDQKFRNLVVRAAARAVMGLTHGNEEKYHVSSNQPANFRRCGSSAERDDDQGSSGSLRRSSLQYLAALTRDETRCAYALVAAKAVTLQVLDSAT